MLGPGHKCMQLEQRHLIELSHCRGTAGGMMAANVISGPAGFGRHHGGLGPGRGGLGFDRAGPGFVDR